MRLLSNTLRISQMICICFCLRSSKQHQGPSQNFIRMARSKAVVLPKSQSSSEIKSQGKKKQTKPSLSIVAEPPAPAEISKENKDDEEGPEAEANDGDEEGGSEVEDREEDSEDGGVDRVGMERLMELILLMDSMVSVIKFLLSLLFLMLVHFLVWMCSSKIEILTISGA